MDVEEKDLLTWNDLTWQDIQSIGMALAERHPDLSILTLPDEKLAALVCALPGFKGEAAEAKLYQLSAIASAWIQAMEGDDDSSPYEFLA